MKKSRSYFAYFLTLFGSFLVAAMVVLDAALFPLETDYEPWYYFFILLFFVLVSIIGLVLSFYWRNIYTTSKKELIFSYIVMTSGFLLFIQLLVNEEYLIFGALGFGMLIVGVATLLSTTLGLRVKRPLYYNINCILRAFPKEVHPSGEAVIKWLKRRRQLNAGNILTSNPNLYYHDFDKVFIPDMVNFNDAEYITADFNAKMIYCCLQTRNRDGHIREKYIKTILNAEYPRWVIPFIVEASSDRVVEIVNAIYAGMNEKLKAEIGNYYRNDLKKFRHDYSKTISYWNEYYRTDYPRYKDYPGYKLFKECYGFKKRYYKEANQISAESKKWNKLWNLYAEGKLEKIPFLLCNYYSGVMGEGHSGFLFNVDNHRQSEDRIADYVEKLKDVLGVGLYDNLLIAVNAYGTKNEEKVCDFADTYFQDHEDKFIELLKRYADDIRLEECDD